MGLAVFDDVGGVQQLGVFDLADCTPASVRQEDPLPEYGLMEPRFRESLDVATCILIQLLTGRDEALALVDRQRELEIR